MKWRPNNRENQLNQKLVLWRDQQNSTFSWTEHRHERGGITTDLTEMKGL